MAQVFDLGRVVGLPGAQGPPGPEGPQGIEGPQGSTGQQGPSGLSAFQIAVQGGFTGTESEYTDLLINVGNIQLALDEILGVEQ